MAQFSHRPSISVQDAIKDILNLCSPVAEAATVTIAASLGRVLFRDAKSLVDVPKYNNSAMDGYAMRFADLKEDGSGMLSVVGKSLAGHPFTGEIPAGACIRIMTGATVPDCCDTVIQQELATVDGSSVTFAPGVQAGGNVRLRGEEIARNNVVIPAGTRLTAAWVGLLATMGIDKVDVFRRPRVAILTTGDELAEPGAPLEEGQIYDANSYCVGAIAETYGADVIRMKRVRDSSDDLIDSLAKAAEAADIIVTSGGVSVGEADRTRFAAEQDGKIFNWEIPMRPGRPLAVGSVHGKPLFCLPGNPVAAAVTFAEFGSYAVRRTGGEAGDLSLPVFTATAESRFKKRPGRYEMQRGIVRIDENGRVVVRTTGMQGSAMLTSMCRGNCIVLIEKDRGPVLPGETVKVQPFFGLFGL